MPQPSTTTLPTSEESGAFEQGPEYWHALINERAAANFLGLTDRSMQAFRQRGDGPRFIRISSRCIRYTRELLKAYADARVRKNTSDAGQAAAQ